jgi:hypothetical protein
MMPGLKRLPGYPTVRSRTPKALFAFTFRRKLSQEKFMRNPTKLSLTAALLSAGFLLSSPASAATAIGSLGGVGLYGDNAVHEVHYRPYKHYHKKRVYRRHFRAYPRYRAYRHYRPYYEDDDDYVYRRPAVRFGLKKYRYYDDDDDDY